MKKISPALRDYRKAIDDLEKIWKDRHYVRCGRCKAVSFMALLEGGTEDLRLAARLSREHAASGADYGMPPCEHDGCAFHEEVTFPAARRMLKLYKGGMGVEDARGRKTGSFALICHGDDRPHGMPWAEAGNVFLRFSRRKVTAHVLPSPPEAGDRDTHPLEALARGWDRHYVPCRDWCLGKYREALDLALADLELDPPRKWELRAPFANRTRGRP